MISELDPSQLDEEVNLVVTQFSSAVETEFISSTKDLTVLKAKIRSIKQMAMGTNLYSGLSHVNKNIVPRSVKLNKNVQLSIFHRHVTFIDQN